MTEAGIATIIKLEGLKVRVYPDIDGNPTLGVGHKLSPTEIKYGTVSIKGTPYSYIGGGITEQQCRDLLAQDVLSPSRAVSVLVTVALNANQADALTIFAFNVGIGSFGGSTLLKKLNAGDYSSVPSELARWNKAGGVVSNGLVNRRNAEIDLWNTPVAEAS